jgi:hypothetical protein
MLLNQWGARGLNWGRDSPGFSALLMINSKRRNRLDVESYFRCALPSTEPRISKLAANMQQQYSHWYWLRRIQL